MSEVGGRAEVDFGRSGSYPVIRFMPPPGCGLRQWPQGRHLALAGAGGPSEGGVTHPGANVPRESASLDTTTTADATIGGVGMRWGCPSFVISLTWPPFFRGKSEQARGRFSHVPDNCALLHARALRVMLPFRASKLLRQQTRGSRCSHLRFASI